MTKFRKLGRPAGHRMSMLRFSLQLFFLLRLTFFLDRNRLIFEVLVSLRTMVSQLVKHERIETTVTKVLY